MLDICTIYIAITYIVIHQFLMGICLVSLQRYCIWVDIVYMWHERWKYKNMNKY